VFETGFRKLAEGYTSSLAWALRHRLVVVLGAFVIAGMAWVLFNSLKREFIPADDQGWFMTATIAPEGSSLSFTDGYQKQVEQIISKVPEVESYFGVVNFGGGVNNGLVFTKLKDYKDRKRTVDQIIGEVQPRDRRIREAGAVRGAESRLRRAGRDHGYIRHPGEADSRPGQH
jgi:multidrug efflux pump